MYTGPNIERDGLVFGYDTGQFSESNPNFDKFKPHKNEGRGAVRFFKGRPITNFIAYQNAVAQSSYTPYSATSSGTWNAKHPNAIRAYNAQGTDITGYVNTGVGDWTNTYHAHWQFDKILKKPVVVMDCFDSNWKAKNFDCRTSAWSTYGMTAGSKYVISWLQWTTNTSKALSVGVYAKNTSGTRGFFDGRSNSNDTTVLNTETGKWQRVYKVYTVSSAHDVTQDYQLIYMYGHSNGPNSNGVTVKIADVQLELNTDHPSSFLDSISTDSKTSRSSTESLIDLTKTTNIDVSNVSFDSNGLPTFDGTDDHITSTLSIRGNGAPHTVEMVFSSNVNQGSLGGRKDPFSIGNSSIHQYSALDVNTTYMNWYFYGKDTTFTNSPQMVANQYYHIVLSYAGGFSNNTNKKVWINGVQQTLSAGVNETPLLPDNPSFSIGRDRGRNTAYWPGKIPVFKVYDRALSQEEAQQNYKAYKNRFNM